MSYAGTECSVITIILSWGMYRMLCGFLLFSIVAFILSWGMHIRTISN